MRYTPLLPRPCPSPLTTDGAAHSTCSWQSPNSSFEKIPPCGVVSITPSSNFHFGSGLRSPRNLDKSLPSNNTIASEGGPPTGPGSTTGGSWSVLAASAAQRPLQQAARTRQVNNGNCEG